MGYMPRPDRPKPEVYEVSPDHRETSSRRSDVLPGRGYAEQVQALQPEAPGAMNSPVQRKGGELTKDVHVAAAYGTQGSGGSLPHLNTIQAAFGHHHVGAVQAHVGGRAQEASEAMGAEAYATGANVAFSRAPSLHTAAHEAAHVIQQAGGVQLAGGVGQVGDGYEKHADAVADRVVAGQSAESLLDRMAGAPGRVQRVVQQAPGVAVQREPTGQVSEARIAVLTAELAGSIAANSWQALRVRLTEKINAPVREQVAERQAGTRPDMTGVGSQMAVGRFAAAAKALKPRWSELTPWWRAQKLYKAANTELTATGVPAMMNLVVQDMTARGGFNAKGWTFLLQKERMSLPTVTDDHMSELAQTTLHEARHCEQHFRAARYLAGQKKDVSEILAADDIPPHIAQAAFANPLTSENGSAQELDEARQWQQSMGPDDAKNGAISGHAKAQIDELERLNAVATQALALFQANPTQDNDDAGLQARIALDAQAEAVAEAYDAYRNIPHEYDANAVGVTANQAYDAL